jgi:hypothetical protein
MNDWQSTYLGRGALPRDLSGFELEAFFTYSESERRVIDDEWRTPSLKLALALQIGFLRMTARLLEALRLVPPALWRHLGTQFDIEAPDLDPEQTKSTINGTFSGHRAPESDDRRQEGPRTTLTICRELVSTARVV